MTTVRMSFTRTIGSLQNVLCIKRDNLHPHLKHKHQHGETSGYHGGNDPHQGTADAIHRVGLVEPVQHDQSQGSNDDVKGYKAAPVPARILQDLVDTSCPNSASPKRWVSLNLRGRSKTIATLQTFLPCL